MRLIGALLCVLICCGMDTNNYESGFVSRQKNTLTVDYNGYIKSGKNIKGKLKEKIKKNHARPLNYGVILKLLWDDVAMDCSSYSGDDYDSLVAELKKKHSGLKRIHVSAKHIQGENFSLHPLIVAIRNGNLSFSLAP